MIQWLSGLALYGLMIASGCSWGVAPRETISVPVPSMEISGMTRIEGNSFLLVSDKKETESPGPRLGVLIVGEDGYRISPIDLAGFSDTDQPNDLEAVCALPRKNHEFLLVESGYYHSKYGRIFYIGLYRHGESWIAQPIGWFRPLPRDSRWKEESTPSSDQLEGIGCIQDSRDRIWLVLGTRGSKSTPAILLWGELKGLDSGQLSFSKQGEHRLEFNPLGDRSISDLFLESLGIDTWRLWASAAVDAGDLGPFRSLIYSPGLIKLDERKELVFSPKQHESSWLVEGLKVEGLAAPATSFSQSTFSIGTDDEKYGGIWRPLFPAQGYVSR